MEFLEPASPEWKAVWQALELATGDLSDQCQESGEVWQYMGTTDMEHQFRHRNRPATARRITGQASQTCSARVYLNLDTITLQVARDSFQAYPKQNAIPAGLTDSRAIGERTEAGREQNRIDRQRQSVVAPYRSDNFYCYDEISDADPGL